MNLQLNILATPGPTPKPGEEEPSSIMGENDKELPYSRVNNDLRNDDEVFMRGCRVATADEDAGAREERWARQRRDVQRWRREQDEVERMQFENFKEDEERRRRMRRKRPAEEQREDKVTENSFSGFNDLPQDDPLDQILELLEEKEADDKEGKAKD